MAPRSFQCETPALDFKLHAVNSHICIQVILQSFPLDCPSTISKKIQVTYKERDGPIRVEVWVAIQFAKPVWHLT